MGGDLRIPHFIGMHALQLLPLLAIGLGWLGRRWAPLADDRTRLRLVWVASAVYAATIAVVTFQALGGQSIVHPGGVYLASGVTIVVLGVARRGSGARCRGAVAGCGWGGDSASRGRRRLAGVRFPDRHRCCAGCDSPDRC